MVVGRSVLVEDRSGVVVGGLLFLRPPLETAGPLEGESRREVASRCSKGGRRSWAHRKETPLAIGISGRRGLSFSEKNADEKMQTKVWFFFESYQNVDFREGEVAIQWRRE